MVMGRPLTVGDCLLVGLNKCDRFLEGEHVTIIIFMSGLYFFIISGISLQKDSKRITQYRKLRIVDGSN